MKHHYSLDFKFIFGLIVYVFCSSFSSSVAYTTPVKKVTASKSCAPLIQTEAAIMPIQSGFWNQNSTWPNGIKPTINDNVVVPDGVDLIALGTCNAKSVTVYGKLSAVNWQEGGAWANLTTNYISVIGENATFEIGTENQPYVSNRGFNLTLIGNNPDAVIPNTSVSSKSIMVMNGATMSLQGKPQVSWSKIAAPANVGDTSISLGVEVNWAIGDEIVITSNRNDPYEAEKRIITGISTDAKTVSFSEPLLYPRTGTLKTYVNENNKSWEVDTRAEVGLLSRNITIQGDESSSENGFGGHIMIMNNAVGNASNVELYRMGQESKIGRYPWHWHLLGETGAGQYFSNSSVHHSFNRAITIHGTWGTLVDNNVAYDHIGHGIFLEDGSEINNTISNNLVLLTKRAKSRDAALLDTDFEPANTFQNAAPSSFWITNANNTFSGNIVAGSEGTAYWFAFPTKPTGDSESDDRFKNMKPHQTPLKLFKNNTAHSCRNAIDINDRLDANHNLVRNGAWSAPGVAQILNFTTFNNALNIYAGIGDVSEDVVYDNLVSANSKLHVMLATKHIIRNSIFIADTEEGLVSQEDKNDELGMYFMYDGPGRIYDSHFVNWDKPYATLFKNNGAAEKRINHLFSGFTYNHDGAPRVNITSYYPRNNEALSCAQVWSNVIKDVDGSVTNTGVPSSIVSSTPYMLTENANPVQFDNWNGMATTSDNFVFFNISNQPLKVVRRDLNCLSETSYATVRCGLGGINQLHLPTGVNYEHSIFLQDESLANFTIRIENAFSEGEPLLVRLPGLGDLPNVSINSIPPSSSLDAAMQSNSTSYFAEPNGDLVIKFVTALDRDIYRFTWDSQSYSVPAVEDATSNTIEAEVFVIASCEGAESSRIKIDYNDNPNHNQLQFSIDGGSTYVQTVNDNSGSTFIDIPNEPLSVFAKWADLECGVEIYNQDVVVSNANTCLRWEFNTDDDFEGWAKNRNLEGNVADGGFNYTIRGGDPVFSSTNLFIGTSVYNYLRVRLKTEVNGTIQFFWGNARGNVSGERLINTAVIGSPDIQEIIIPLFENANWEDISASARIDFQFPINSIGHVDLIAFEQEDLRDCNGTWDGPNECSLWEFNEDNDAEGWSFNQNLTGDVTNGSFNYTVLGGDPIFDSEMITLDTNDYNFLRVRLRAEVNGLLQFFWGNANGSFGARRQINHQVTGSPDFQEVIIPLSGNSNWSGISKRVRVDFQFPVNSVGNVDLISFEAEDLRDCDGIWQGPDDCPTLGVDEVTSNAVDDITIYPVPANNAIYLQLPNIHSDIVRVQLYAVTGKQVLTAYNSRNTPINISELLPGVYFAKINLAHATVVKTFVKQ